MQKKSDEADNIPNKYWNDPMTLLLAIYAERQDLQRTFPEVKNGQYQRLLEWVCNYGTTIDMQKELLVIHKDWYASQLPEAHKERGNLAKIVFASIKTIKEEGTGSFVRKSLEKFHKREFKILGELSPSSGHYAYRLFPHSPEQYRLWMSFNQPSPESLTHMRIKIDQLSYRPRISICMAVYNTEEHYISGAINSVLNQVYEDWELIVVDGCSNKPHVRPLLKFFAEQDKRVRVYLKETNGGLPKDMNEAYSKATGDYIVILDSDDIIEPHALYELVHYLNYEGRDLDLIYSDEALIDTKDQVNYIWFRPDFSLDLLLSYCYFCHMTAIKRSFLMQLGGYDEVFSVTPDYDFFLRVAVQTKRIGHIPKVLYRYRLHENSFTHVYKDEMVEQSRMAISRAIKMMGIEATVEDGLSFNYFRVKRRLKDESLSVIILTKNVHLLENCVKSIVTKTRYENYEIIIVANNLDSDEEKNYLEKIALDPRCKITHWSKPFNYSAMCNYAASIAKGQHLLFLNDDTTILAEESIEAMLEHSQRDTVGAVGAKLLYPDNTIQHAGVIIGLFDCCEHIHKCHPSADAGYLGWVAAIRNYSAVTGACMMIPRKIFETVGGFDEKLSVTFNDIDLCLRIRQLGYLVVYTPHAVLYHYEQATRKKLRHIHPYEQHMLFKNSWREIIEKGDPYYNPNLSRWHYDCRPRFG